jgi:dihydroxyacetone synthase
LNNSLGTFFRALPNMNLIRPADAEEVLGAWEVALDSPHTPSIFCTTRQEVPLLEGSDRSKVKLGAYPIFSTTTMDDVPELIIIATGSEVYRAIEAAKKLASSLRVRVVSMPSQSHFDSQPAEYRRCVLATGKALAVAIESWGSYGWAKYAHASFSMHTFGLSAPVSSYVSRAVFAVYQV